MQTIKMDPVLKKNFTYLFLLQNVNYIIPLLLLPYLTRTLGVENFGKIAFVQAFVTYFILLTDFGFNTSATQDVVKVRDNKSALTTVFWSTIVTKLLFAFVGLFVFVILLISIPKLQQMNLLLIIAFTGVLSSVLFPIWLFQGLEKMSHITWLNVIPKILVLICTLIFIKQKTDYVLALSIQVIGTLASALACTFLIFKEKIVSLYLPCVDDIKSAIIEGWHIFASGVATNLYTTTNIVVLGFVSGDAAVGIFSASEKIIRSIISLFSSVSQVTFPRINTYYNKSKEQALVFGNKVLSYAAVSTFALGVLLFISAPLIVKILFGVPQYAETIIVLRISSFIPLFSICNGILAINLLITFGLKRYLVKIVGIGGIFSLLVIVPTVFLYQARGVAIVATLTEILITIMLLYVFKKHQIKIKLI
jgi:PST family polysaccharide transporter